MQIRIIGDYRCVTAVFRRWIPKAWVPHIQNHRPFLRWIGKEIDAQRLTFKHPTTTTTKNKRYSKRTYIFMIVLSEAVISPYM